MTHAEFLTAHALIDAARGHGPDADVARCSRGTAWRPSTSRRSAARGNRYRRGVPGAAGRVRPHASTATRVAMGRRDVARHRRLWPFARARGAATARSAGVLICGRHAAAADQHQRQPSGRPSPTAIRSRGSSIRSRAFEALPADTLVLPSHGLPFRGIAAARRAAARASRRAAGRARTPRSRGTGAASARPTWSRCCSAASSTCSSAIFAMGEAIAHLNHLWHAGRARARCRDGRRASASPRNMDAAARSQPRTRCRRLLTTASPAASPAAGGAGYDPVALAESLASAAEKSAKLMGDFAARNAGKQAVARQRRARPRQGVHGARREDARPIPRELAEGADEPVVGLHEPVAELDAADAGRAGDARRRARARATSASGTRTGRSTSCSTTSSRAT